MAGYEDFSQVWNSARLAEQAAARVSQEIKMEAEAKAAREAAFGGSSPEQVFGRGADRLCRGFLKHMEGSDYQGSVMLYRRHTPDTGLPEPAKTSWWGLLKSITGTPPPFPSEEFSELTRGYLIGYENRIRTKDRFTVNLNVYLCTDGLLRLGVSTKHARSRYHVLTYEGEAETPQIGYYEEVPTTVSCCASNDASNGHICFSTPSSYTQFTPQNLSERLLSIAEA